jgi:hypothetical protein
MSNTRRYFLQSSAAVAAGLTGAVSAGGAQAPSPASVQVPKVKFGKAEISRVVIGANQFYGYSHFNSTYDTVMKEWYTPSKVVEILQRAESYGINAFQALGMNRCVSDCERLQAEGGKMQYVVQADSDPDQLVKSLKPLGIYHSGEVTDRNFRTGKSDAVRDYCKRVRQAGVLVGVGSHNPEFLAKVEDQGWDVDFYAGCVYNRTRTAEEWRQLLGNETLEMASETYVQSDPPRMYKFMKQTTKHCFAFKILAAGRVASVERAFRTAFESIKPTDCVFVGMFPRTKDEVKENAEIASRILRPS